VTLLKVENLTKRFGSLAAVSDVSLEVNPGEIRAVIGPNGAGKTTFFNMISGFLAPSRGRILFAGKDITRMPPNKRVKVGMARTFQITEVFPELTVRENLKIAIESATGHSLSVLMSEEAFDEVRAEASELMELSGLTPNARRLAGELSHGDQRATEIMMALALKPRLLLLDEPTAGMGERETFEIAKLIRKLHRRRNLTIVLIEHDMRIVFNLADRIMVLAEGRMLAEGTPKEIAANEAVQRAYLGTA
jgi:branched-chain amino acid transport system ATP-binding protein